MLSWASFYLLLLYILYAEKRSLSVSVQHHFRLHLELCTVGLISVWILSKNAASILACVQVWSNFTSSFFAAVNVLTTITAYCCDRKSRAAYVQSFALWQQATIELTCHDHSSRTLLLRSIVDIVGITRDYMPRLLYYCLFAPHICMVLFFTHIPFVVNHTFNATSPERLQHYHLPLYQCVAIAFQIIILSVRFIVPSVV